MGKKFSNPMVRAVRPPLHVLLNGVKSPISTARMYISVWPPFPIVPRPTLWPEAAVNEAVQQRGDRGGDRKSDQRANGQNVDGSTPFLHTRPVCSGRRDRRGIVRRDHSQKSYFSHYSTTYAEIGRQGRAWLHGTFVHRSAKAFVLRAPSWNFASSPLVAAAAGLTMVDPKLMEFYPHHPSGAFASRFGVRVPNLRLTLKTEIAWTY